jgi:hypothetical protein
MLPQASGIETAEPGGNLVVAHQCLAGELRRGGLRHRPHDGVGEVRESLVGLGRKDANRRLLPNLKDRVGQHTPPSRLTCHYRQGERKAA